MRYEQLFEFQQHLYVERQRFGATANLFARRVVIDATRGFDATMKSGGDADFGQRATALGFGIGYAEKATIRHPSRVSVREVLLKNRRIAAGFYGHALRDHGGVPARPWRWLAWWWRLRPREWWHIVSGARGSARYALHHRLGVLALHVLLHYHTAWCLLSTHLSHGRSHATVR